MFISKKKLNKIIRSYKIKIKMLEITISKLFEELLNVSRENRNLFNNYSRFLDEVIRNNLNSKESNMDEMLLNFKEYLKANYN